MAPSVPSSQVASLVACWLAGGRQGERRRGGPRPSSPPSNFSWAPAGLACCRLGRFEPPGCRFLFRLLLAGPDRPAGGLLLLLPGAFEGSSAAAAAPRPRLLAASAPEEPSLRASGGCFCRRRTGLAWAWRAPPVPAAALLAPPVPPPFPSVVGPSFPASSLPPSSLSVVVVVVERRINPLCWRSPIAGAAAAADEEPCPVALGRAGTQREADSSWGHELPLRAGGRTSELPGVPPPPPPHVLRPSPPPASASASPRSVH